MVCLAEETPLPAQIFTPASAAQKFRRAVEDVLLGMGFF